MGETNQKFFVLFTVSYFIYKQNPNQIEAKQISNLKKAIHISHIIPHGLHDHMSHIQMCRSRLVPMLVVLATRHSHPRHYPRLFSASLRHIHSRHVLHTGFGHLLWRDPNRELKERGTEMAKEEQMVEPQVGFRQRVQLQVALAFCSSQH